MIKKKANFRPLNEILILSLLLFSCITFLYAMTAVIFFYNQQTNQVWTLVSILASNLWTHILRNKLP